MLYHCWTRVYQCNVFNLKFKKIKERDKKKRPEGQKGGCHATFVLACTRDPPPSLFFFFFFIFVSCFPSVTLSREKHIQLPPSVTSTHWAKKGKSLDGSQIFILSLSHFFFLLPYSYSINTIYFSPSKSNIHFMKKKKNFMSSFWPEITHIVVELESERSKCQKKYFFKDRKTYVHFLVLLCFFFM